MNVCTLDAITTKPAQVSPREKPGVSFTYVDISSVNNRRKVVEEPQHLLGADAPSRARKLLRAGDVIVSMTRPNLNAVALIGEDLDGSVASTGFAVLRPSASILPEFLFQLVQTPRFVSGMTKLTAGQMYPAVSERDVRGFNVSLPPLDEQRRIVDLLGRAAGLKRLAEEAQTKARELIPALFLDMFGDPATNPKGWPLVPLGDTFDAADYGTSVKANDSAGVPVLRMGNVSSSPTRTMSNCGRISSNGNGFAPATSISIGPTARNWSERPACGMVALKRSQLHTLFGCGSVPRRLIRCSSGRT